MMIKCLRALPTAMAAEHGQPGDIFLAAPGELLSIPVHACQEKNNPKCQCRRVFIGLSSGQPTTLARVGVSGLLQVQNECDQSDAIARVMDDLDREVPNDGVLLHNPEGLAYAIRNFAPGTILRVSRTEDSILLEDTWRIAAEEHRLTV